MNREMSKQTDLIASTDEAWENGELGCSKAHVKVVDDITEELINEALDLPHKDD
ncbi:hypothetical protein ID853_13360 [Xenorhabdus sp. Vera]|uniref:hypothetical protein n=1 Tax=Xenorhabdus koppenhoeferi TaxID=351659 RepID=UPI0019A6C062|nr:hypothetical protein [Xenorhabdus sp. Vera]MBD2811849.1 hypothetical protein [Xenorhabdus sp. Vera]